MDSQRSSTDTGMRLSALWIVIMFCMLTIDVLSTYMPGAQEEMLAFAGGTPISTLMLVAAIIMVLPIAMIYFSRTLRRSVNRWANIVVAAITIVYVIGGGSSYPHYYVLGAVEVIASLAIIAYAWRWRGASA